jgi:hypothetical protein
VSLLQHLDHRPVRDPLAVGEAAPLHDHDVVCSQSLGDQPRLPDARVADDRDERAPLLGQRPLQRGPDEPDLALAADEWRLVAALGCLADLQEPVRANRLRLPLELERRDRLYLDRLADQCERGLSEQHLARPRRLLEPRGDVDGIPRRQAFLGPGDDHAGVEPDACLEPELRERVAHLRRSPNCA